MRNRKTIFLFLNQNICCGYSKEPSHRDGSFEHLKHMLKIMSKNYAENFCLSKPVDGVIYFLLILVWKGVSQSCLERGRGRHTILVSMHTT